MRYIMDSFFQWLGQVSLALYLLIFCLYMGNVFEVTYMPKLLHHMIMVTW